MPQRPSIRAIFLQGILILGMTAIASAQDQFSAQFVIFPRALDCSPKILRPGQSLTLTLNGNGVHGRELAIERKDQKRWYYLVSAYPQPGPKMLMTPDQFEKASRVVIPADIMADHEGKSARVFTTPGRYTVYTSPNLESEQDGYRCEIEFRR